MALVQGAQPMQRLLFVADDYVLRRILADEIRWVGVCHRLIRVATEEQIHNTRHAGWCYGPTIASKKLMCTARSGDNLIRGKIIHKIIRLARLFRSNSKSTFRISCALQYMVRAHSRKQRHRRYSKDNPYGGIYLSKV